MGTQSGIIEELTTDHRRIQQLFDRIRSAPPGSDERMSLVQQASITLVRHAAAEKEYLYPAVRRFLAHGDAWSERELATHRQTEELLGSLEALEPDADESAHLLLSLITQVTDHIVEQEQLLFPRLLSSCPPDALQELGAKTRNAYASAPTRPRPQAPDAAPLVKLTAHAWGPWDRLRDLVTRRGRK